ncbi:YggS family pyridoxal phosphate-dependent enzyme [Campylobacter sp. CCUG 57310]|uniref:YggS family pyridoxal phosphate-dependent enzyme n=1 Tax=Campylobacter sp. CCUG 57310 TaxID=2517362 RepID=UPI001564A012|nr:YggS family pyridoxal phosphate-dependent enzyme [Campylobacter sp. CCUG 57310]QKF92195.1 type III pyridoxal 5-phosphate (PLP)-dependent enzyme, YggS family [Campylobacter sp. CCUG 57310]
MSNLEEILKRINSTGLNEAVKLVAVSKNVTVKEVLELFNEGQVDFGENRVQELKNKQQILAEILPQNPIKWHFIGRLQSNKINQLISLRPTLWQSCESLKAALEVDKRLNYELECLLQINSAEEESKQGVEAKMAVETFLSIKERCKFLRPVGVMSIGAHVDDIKTIQKSFETTRKIYEELEQYGAKICSMGMSSDFELAIKCGSNMVRLGSVLYK